MLRASSPIRTIKGSFTVWNWLCYLSHSLTSNLPEVAYCNTKSCAAKTIHPLAPAKLQTWHPALWNNAYTVTLDQYIFCWSCLKERSLPDSRAVRNGKPTQVGHARLWRSHASASIVQLLSVGLKLSWDQRTRRWEDDSERNNAEYAENIPRQLPPEFQKHSRSIVTLGHQLASRSPRARFLQTCDGNR